MLKGIQKNMVWVRLPGSRHFEAAYFVMRTDPPPHAKENEMMKEANKILAESNVFRHKSSSAKRQLFRMRCFSFFCGACIGAAIVALCWLFVLLFG